MRQTVVLTCFVFCFGLITSQVSINTSANPPDPSSMLDVSDTERGLLIPRLSLSQRNAIVMPATALLIYQTDNQAGFYFNKGTPVSPEWISLSTLSDIIHLEDRIPIDSLPYNITAPGSYYVTENLLGPVGITISSSHVTLDLNGYALKGTPGNTSEGIEVTAAVTNITIRNGSIVTWGREGIRAITATSSSISQLQILNNAYDGLTAGNNNLLSYVVASNNGFDGIDLGENASIFHCTTANNLNDGIEADAGSNLTSCSASNNSQHGIRTTGPSSISNCTSSENNNHGFSCGSGSVVKQSTASNNTQDGFYLSHSCLASENNARNNGNHGFEWLSECLITSNSATLNGNSGFSTTFSGGKVDGNTSSVNINHGFNIQNAGGTLVIRNTASGNGLNAFNVLPGNSFAAIVTSSTINTNSNPFANFQL